MIWVLKKKSNNKKYGRFLQAKRRDFWGVLDNCIDNSDMMVLGTNTQEILEYSMNLGTAVKG